MNDEERERVSFTYRELEEHEAKLLMKGYEQGKAEQLEEIDAIVTYARTLFISKESSRQDLIDIIDNLLGFLEEIQSLTSQPQTKQGADDDNKKRHS